MTERKKTYYQVSFTGGQALAAVAVVIIALGVSFFLGAKAGFERGPEPNAAPAPRATVPVGSAAATGSTTTATEPEAAATSGSGTEEAPVFEDREAGLPEAKTSVAPQAPSRTEIAGGPAGSAAKKPSASGPTGENVKPAPEAKRAEPAKPAEAGAKTSPERAAAHGYFVQILSTSSKAEASRWKEKLAARSWHTAAVTTVPSKKGTLWRVRVGPYPDAAQAKKAAAKISAEFRQKAWVAPQ